MSSRRSNRCPAPLPARRYLRTPSRPRRRTRGSWRNRRLCRRAALLAPMAASSVAPVASGHERSLRPCLGTIIAPRRRATFRQTLLQAPRADPAGGVPGLPDARDLHDVARVRRVHEAAAPDVDADVAEAVEEDEISGRQLRAGHRAAVLVLPRDVVRKRDPDLPVDVHREARAVEARGRRSAPTVGNAQVAERDRHDLRMPPSRRRWRGVRRRRWLRRVLPVIWL